MTVNYIDLARSNRLFALTELRIRREAAARSGNVMLFPATANRNARPVPVFTTTRGQRADAALAA